MKHVPENLDCFLMTSIPTEDKTTVLETPRKSG